MAKRRKYSEEFKREVVGLTTTVDFRPFDLIPPPNSEDHRTSLINSLTRYLAPLPSARASH